MLSEKPDKVLFGCVCLPGFAYSLMAYLASNTGFRAISTGLAAYVVASCCLGWDGMRALAPSESKGLRRAVTGAAAVSLALAVGVTGFMRMEPLIRPDVPTKRSVRIAQGPAEGLRVPPEEANRHQAVYATFRQYAMGPGNLIITRLAPWAYMVSPMRCGAPTTWRLRLTRTGCANT